MINNERIVPVVKTDYLSLIGTILGLNGTSYTVAKSPDVEGNFVIEAEGAAGNVLANQPVKTLDFADGTTSATVYFVADYNFVGFSIDGAAVVATGTVVADGISLYKAVLADSAITVTAVTPAVE